MSLRTSRRKGYLAAALGSAVGAAILITLGWHLGFAYTQKFMPNAELDGIIPPLIGGLVGWVIGSVLGCWLALRWRPYQGAGKTTALLAALTPFGIFLWVFVFTNFIAPQIQFDSVGGTMNVLEFAQIQNTVRQITIGFTVVTLALLSRFLT